LSTGSVEPKMNRPAGHLASSTVFVLAGQAAFVACGFLLHAYLGHAIDPATYGLYGVVMAVLTWTQNALNNGVPWAVRRFLPADPGASRDILRVGLRCQVMVALVLYTLCMVLAPWLAAAVHDPGLTWYLRIAFTDLLGMAFYTFYRGALNGLRLFAAQGLVVAAYAAAKLALSVLLVRLGYSLSGALIGNALASVAGWLVAFLLLRRGMRSASTRAEEAIGGSSRRYDARAMLGFGLPTVLFALASSFLSTVGVIAVKALVSDGVQVGYYVAANLMATAPTMLLAAFSRTLFPHLAGSIANEDWGLTRAYIRSGVRYLALTVLPGALLVLGTSRQLITLVYPEHYAAAASLLNLLFIGTGLHSLYMIFANAILAEGRVFLALIIPAGLVPASLVVIWYLTSQIGPLGAAYGTVLVLALSVVLAAAYVLRRFAVRLDWASLMRVSAASLVIYGLTRLVVVQGAWLVPYYAALGAAYLALLCLVGELDIRALSNWRAMLSGALGGKGAKIAT